MGKHLPAVPDDPTLASIQERAVQRSPESLVEELQLQNQELIKALEAEQRQRLQLVQLQDELRQANELLQQTNIALHDRASRDPLTGLHNRLKFNEAMEVECARAGRHRYPLALILFDIDHFKQVNDDFGHACGDEVLIEIADLTGLHLRRGDLLCRWGGEEFTVICPHCTLDEGRAIAEKLRRLVHDYRFALPRRITCSFGVTVYVPPEDDKAFFQRADQALYQAKNAGRDRTVALAPAGVVHPNHKEHTP